MTSTDELQHACDDVPGFLGVYASDELEGLTAAMDSAKPRLGGFSAIFNYSPITQGGSHWIAMARLRDAGGRPGMLMDSFGSSPDRDDAILRVKTHFAQFLRANSRGEPLRNQFDLEGARGDACGEYAAIFVRGGVGLYEKPIAQSLPELDKRFLESNATLRFKPPWKNFFPVRRIGPAFVPTASTVASWQADMRNEAVAEKNDLTAQRMLPVRSRRKSREPVGPPTIPPA